MRPPPQHVAAAVAGALLAGEWQPDAMRDRAQAALHPSPRALPRTVRIVAEIYSRPPLDAPRELARVVGAALELADDEHPRVRRPHPVATEMIRRPWRVAVLNTVQDLGALLGEDAGALDWLCDVRGLERHARDERLRHYRWSWHPRPGGRPPRPIAAPKSRLKAAQRTLLREVLDPIPAHPAAHGFVRGRGVLSHARAHAGRRLVMRIDLADFFASVPAGRIFGVLRSAGYPEPVAHAMTALTTTVVPQGVWRAAPTADFDLGRRLAAPHLPQGAPTSPALANLAAHRLDRRLAGLAAAFEATYTRYADDLVFSGDGRLVGRSQTARRAILDIVADEGFTPREDKTAHMTRAGRQRVTGVVVNAHPNVGREEHAALRALIHDARRHGPASANRAGVPDLRAHVLGRVSWVEQVNPERGARLREAADQVDWSCT